MIDPISLYCDGSAHDRRGWPGGWAFAAVSQGQALLIQSGGERSTTNNVMEMTAALWGLRAVIERGWQLDRAIELVSDSTVTLQIAAGSWNPKIPDPLAAELRAACVQARATTRWVKGHSGDEWNERVDALAGTERQARVPERVRKRAARRTQLRSVTQRGY